MLKTGIVGLPNVGKSTLFNALTRSRKAEAANYPFCTIDPNVGVVTVPDDRLVVLQKIAKTNVVIPAAIEFVDIAGLVAGASKGEGLHHVGYRVADCAVALQSVKDAGGRVIDEAPRPGSRGTTVAFVHPKTSFGTLIELVQE